MRIFRERRSTAFDIPQGNTAIVAPSAISLPANDATVAISFCRRSPRQGNQDYLLVGNDGTGRWGVYLSSNSLSVFYQGTNYTTAISCVMNSQIEAIVRFKSTGVDFLVYVDGVLHTDSVAGTLTTRATAALTVGRNSDSTYGFLDAALVASVGQIVCYQRAITDSERTTLATWLRTKRAPKQFPTNAPLIMLEGDSIATDVLQFYTHDSWANMMLPNLWPTWDVRLEDAAVSGSKIADVAARYASTVMPYLSSVRAINVVILAIGTNSLAEAAKSATAYLADLYSLADSIRAAAPVGTRIIGQTILPREVGAFGTPSSFESDRQTWNAAIRTGYAAHFDALADVAALTHMGAFGDSANTTYYQDGVHPTVAGETLLETAYRAPTIAVMS